MVLARVLPVLVAEALDADLHVVDTADPSALRHTVDVEEHPRKGDLGEVVALLLPRPLVRLVLRKDELSELDRDGLEDEGLVGAAHLGTPDIAHIADNRNVHELALVLLGALDLAAERTLLALRTTLLDEHRLLDRQRSAIRPGLDALPAHARLRLGVLVGSPTGEVELDRGVALTGLPGADPALVVRGERTETDIEGLESRLGPATLEGLGTNLVLLHLGDLRGLEELDRTGEPVRPDLRLATDVDQEVFLVTSAEARVLLRHAIGEREQDVGGLGLETLDTDRSDLDLVVPVDPDDREGLGLADGRLVTSLEVRLGEAGSENRGLAADAVEFRVDEVCEGLLGDRVETKENRIRHDDHTPALVDAAFTLSLG